MTDLRAEAEYALDVREAVWPEPVDFLLWPGIDPKALVEAIREAAIERAIERTESAE